MTSQLFTIILSTVSVVALLSAVAVLGIVWKRSGTMQSVDLQTAEDEVGPALIARYHREGLGQARISFWFSIAFAVIGFMIIILSTLQYTGVIAESTLR